MLALICVSAGAQDSAHAPKSTVRATGEATVTAVPDQARISIGVVNQAATADKAAAANAQQSDAVIKQLRGLLGSNAEIKTINYSISPDYNFNGGRQKITGYTANNTVRVRIDDLKDVGRVIDAVAENGANTISGIQFTLRDERAVRIEALRRAAAQAKANAEAIASAMGLRVVGVISAEAGEPSMPHPVFAMAAMRAAPGGAPTPVEAGTLDVGAVVTVTLEVTQ